MTQILKKAIEKCIKEVYESGTSSREGLKDYFWDSWDDNMYILLPEEKKAMIEADTKLIKKIVEVIVEKNYKKLPR